MLDRLTQMRDGRRRDRFDRLAQHALTALPGPFLPWSDFAMRPGGVLTVLNDIWLNDRQTVVECGGGVSTLYIGRLLRQRAHGTLVTVEHDESWSARLRAQVAREGLEDVVTVVHAPLTGHVSGGEWYDAAKIPPVRDVDLLLIDGPPAYDARRAQSRYGALPHFFSALAPGATVVLDDVLRPGEQAVSQRWREEYGLELELRPTAGAIGVGVKR